MMAAFLVTMMALPAAAADGKRVAFVVGIGTYDKLPSHQQLKNPLNDAEGVSKKLTGIGFHVVQAPNLTRSNFNAQWQDVLNTLTEDDTFVLYFSEHGVQIDGQNYLLPRDIPYIEQGRQEQLTREAISLNELLSDLTRRDRPHPKRAVVILDACRDNPLISPEHKSAATRGGLAKLPDSDGIFVIYSAGSNKTALDRLSPSDPVKYSVFTRVLLPLLERTDFTIQKLSTELRHQVAQLAQKAGREQRPSYYDGIPGQFCLPGCEVVSNVGGGEPGKPPVAPSFPNTITGEDGAPMVLIPAGEFWMGSSDRERHVDEYPRHQIYLDAYYMDKFEVTVSRYAEFMRSTDRKAPEYWDQVSHAKHGNFPVMGVDWHDAEAYCRRAWKRLPTEAEWEKAARGTDGRTYPWGDEPPTTGLANFGKWYGGHIYDDRLLAPVDSYEVGRSPYGLHHMAGNVSEWTADWYDGQYYEYPPERNPTGPSSDTGRKVLRGGFCVDGPDDVRSAHRAMRSPTHRSELIGFRCAQNRPK